MLVFLFSTGTRIPLKTLSATALYLISHLEDFTIFSLVFAWPSCILTFLSPHMRYTVVPHTSSAYLDPIQQVPPTRFLAYLQNILHDFLPHPFRETALKEQMISSFHTTSTKKHKQKSPFNLHCHVAYPLLPSCF